MSVSFTRRARYFTFAGLATIALGGLAQVAVSPAASSADTYTVPLHQQPPITNSGYPEKGDCDGSPAQWGWHFVLPSGDATWVSLTVTFQTAGTLTLGPSDFPSPTKHAYLYTPTDDTLTAASGEVTGGSAEFFNLSHVCTGGGTTETPSPTPSVSPTTVPPTTVPPTTVPPTTVPPTTVPPTTVPPTTVPPTTVPPTTVPPTTVPPTTVPPTTEVPTVLPTTLAPPTTNVPTVLPTQLVRTPSVTPSVLGEKKVKTPVVRGSRLTRTGTPVPIALLLLLGFGLIGAGVLATVAGEPRAATAGGGKHRK